MWDIRIRLLLFDRLVYSYCRIWHVMILYHTVSYCRESMTCHDFYIIQFHISLWCNKLSDLTDIHSVLITLLLLLLFLLFPLFFLSFLFVIFSSYFRCFYILYLYLLLSFFLSFLLPLFTYFLLSFFPSSFIYLFIYIFSFYIFPHTLPRVWPHQVPGPALMNLIESILKSYLS